MIHEETSSVLIHKGTSSKGFVRQVEPGIGLNVEKFTEARDKIFNKEQELFYRATDYRGS